MEDVAALAEVGKGTLYRYFEDKEELYVALLVRAGAGLSSRLRAEAEQAGGPRAQLVAIVRALLGYFGDHPHLFDLIQHAEVMQRPDRELPWRKTREETMALVRSVFETAEKVGEFFIDDWDTATLMLLGGLRAIVRFGAKERPDDLPERLVEGLLVGHARPRTAARVGQRWASAAN